MRTTSIRIISCLLLLFTCFGIKAQDAHFSQYFSSPLYTNPALTGQIDGAFRLNGLYRTQWNAFTDAYTTGSFSADARLGQFGLGLTVVDMQSGTNNFNTLSFLVSGAYDLAYNSNTNQHFIFGLQAGIFNKSVDSKNTTVPDQFVPGFGPVNPVNEDFDNLSVLSPDISFGLLWFNGSSKLRYSPFAGLSVFHLLQPYDSFDKSAKLPMRFLVHGGLRYRTSSAIDIIPHLKVTYQQTAYNAIAGCNVSYALIDTHTRLEGGVAYRLNDAIVPYVGATHKDISFGVSFDTNVSTLSDVGSNKNSLEVSLTYVNRKNNLKKQFICPRL